MTKIYCEACDNSYVSIKKHQESTKHINNQIELEKTKELQWKNEHSFNCHKCGVYNMNIKEMENHIQSIPHLINENEWDNQDSDTDYSGSGTD